MSERRNLLVTVTTQVQELFLEGLARMISMALDSVQMIRIVPNHDSSEAGTR